MQITSHYPHVSINTANPATEQARRDMQRRELVEPVREPEKGPAERSLSNDERQRGTQTPTGPLLYDSNGKETETSQAIAGREDDSSGEQSSKQQQDNTSERQEQAEQQEIKELQARDQEVRAHEQAHAVTGGRYAGSPSYEYQQGPDGKRYAVGGEVQIDIAPVSGDPQATIQKMQQVKAAALAPAEPSSADRRIAAEATQRLLQAQAEVVAENNPVKANKNASKPVDGTADTTATSAKNDTAANTTTTEITPPQRERLAMLAQMQQRSQVISNFYQLATAPQTKQYLQQA